jgi:peptidoglycan/LPS O-acetylase OafA/YrhL
VTHARTTHLARCVAIHGGQQPVGDGLRGIAVLLVIAVHVGLLRSGDVGVDVFFPLSGFLITALLYEEWERRGALTSCVLRAPRAPAIQPGPCA